MGSKSDGSRPQRHVEVERKFDVGPDGVTPCFDGLAAVNRVERQPTQALEALYFDTAGHHLAGNRITLRRRTGGPDSGWHLKLPAGPDARTEVRAPLDTSSAPPDELVDVVRAIVRDRPLVPVAGISTVRNVTMLYGADDAELAEFCDDEVTARAIDPGDGTAGPDQSWHEWELELVASSGAKSDARLLDQLGNRLLDAGGFPAGHGSKLAKVLSTARPAPSAPAPSSDPVHRAVAEHIAELVEWDRAVRADTYDSVHQMRVTTRKLRSLLQSSSEAFGLTDDAWVLDELRQLAGVLGVARDAEVLAERYDRAIASLPPELVRGPVRERLVDGARKRYQAGLHRSLTAMRSSRYFRLLDALEQLVVDVSAEHGRSQSQSSVDSAYRRVRKAAKSAADAAKGDRDEALHRIRKGAKKLRYVAAATGESKVADRAKSVQTILGEHQDAVVSRIHLLQQAAAAHDAGEDTFTYGLLHQREDDLARSCHSQLDDALDLLRKTMHKAHH